jgi:hypothetical protein
MQVYSTERYVSPNALRSICFLLTRHGPNDHATLAAYGALRETGKLLIFLSDSDLIEMLQMRDVQLANADKVAMSDSDPTLLLDQKIYIFLAQMPR